MGYTHYWTQPRSFTQDEWAKLCDVCHKVIVQSGEAILNGWGEGSPTITTEMIALNGDASIGLDHETFSIARIGADKWAFCKTAHKPYDIVVTALLSYLAAYHDFDVSSDGDHHAWEAGVDLANQATGLTIANPIFVKELIHEPGYSSADTGTISTR